ncbi:hypothetical protein GTQ55_06005 [Microbulbifer hydrolyticus]|uniref:Lipoprotein n=1 Tax=Microbulbifer hydrolyticus TaxID=48074 RepID=A0ABX6IV14_9GAMM|nr:hypothetical protein GTQ55_06005 [Microbulbifer hydrolyticus]
MKKILQALICTSIILFFGCAEDLVIEVEPRYGFTFAPATHLTENDEISIEILRLGKEERLRFHKCGPDCNTAVEVSSVGVESVKGSNIVTFHANENGKYYFWLNNTKAKEQKSAVKVKRVKNTLKGAFLEFESGSEIFIIRGKA